jgi:restriction system protein
MKLLLAALVGTFLVLSPSHGQGMFGKTSPAEKAETSKATMGQFTEALASTALKTVLPVVLFGGLALAIIGATASRETRKLLGGMTAALAIGIWSLAGTGGIWAATGILMVLLTLVGLGKLAKRLPRATPGTQPFPDLETLDWHQLERLVAKYMESEGFQVNQRGGQKADGGIDLIAQKDRQIAIQCKHWKKWSCGPETVRELIGSMTLEKIPEGILVCREATDAARKTAEAGQIAIWDKPTMTRKLQAWPGFRQAVATLGKVCPRCGAELVMRRPKQGSGDPFWGCIRFPKCRGTIKT